MRPSVCAATSQDHENHETTKATKAAKKTNFFTSCSSRPSWFTPSSSPSRLEGRPEPQLQLPRFVRDIILRHRRPEVRRADRRHVIAVVDVIEQVEHFDNAVKRCVIGQTEIAKQAHVHAVRGLADECVALLALP